MSTTQKISSGKTVLAILASIAALVISQLLAVTAGVGIVALGVPAAVGNVVSAALYILLAGIVLKIICEKLLGISLSECRITKLRIKPIWAVSAFLMPIIATGGLILTGGQWEISDTETVQAANLITATVCMISIAGGTVEEAVFRGVIMKAIEIRWNKTAAVIIPSAVFGILHILNGSLSFIGFIQLIAAGSIVGILFSLVTYESGSIWSGAFMHCIWNIFTAGSILNISSEAMENALINFVLKTKSPLITGGDFGTDASIISIGAYLIFTVIALILLNKKKEKE